LGKIIIVPSAGIIDLFLINDDKSNMHVQNFSYGSAYKNTGRL